MWHACVYLLHAHDCCRTHAHTIAAQKSPQMYRTKALKQKEQHTYINFDKMSCTDLGKSIASPAEAFEEGADGGNDGEEEESVKKAGCLCKTLLPCSLRTESICASQRFI